MRIWFGDKIKAKGTVEIYDGIYATDKREIWEKERSGIASLNPFTFTTANFNFDAFDIERGKETFIIFRFPINSIVYDALSEWWEISDFRRIAVRTTRIK